MIAVALVVASQTLLPAVEVRSAPHRNGFFLTLTSNVSGGIGIHHFEAPRAAFRGQPPPPPGDFVSNNVFAVGAAGLDLSVGYGIKPGRAISLDGGAVLAAFGHNEIDRNTTLLGMASLHVGVGASVFLDARERLRVLASLGAATASFASSSTEIACTDCVYRLEVLWGPWARFGVGYTVGRRGGAGFSVAARMDTAALGAAHQWFFPIGLTIDAGLIVF